MPVHEGTVGVFFPRPHVQRVERRQAESVRAFEQVKELSHELRRPDAGFAACHASASTR